MVVVDGALLKLPGLGGKEFGIRTASRENSQETPCVFMSIGYSWEALHNVLISFSELGFPMLDGLLYITSLWNLVKFFVAHIVGS